MSKDFEYSVRPLAREDETSVMKLVSNEFSPITDEIWMWKYPLNPHFVSSLVAVAEKNGKIVGCSHYLPRELKVSGTLKAKAALGADLTVHPNHRRQGIGSNLLRFFRSSRILSQKGVVLTYGFVDPDRAGYYNRVISSVEVPLSTVVYKKFLNLRKFEEKVLSLSRVIESNGELKDEIGETNLRVAFRLTGAPPFVLKITRDGISLEKEIVDPDIAFEGDPFFFDSIFEESKGILSLVSGFLRGKIRVYGGLGKIFSFYRFYRALKRFSDGK